MWHPYERAMFSRFATVPGGHFDKHTAQVCLDMLGQDSQAVRERELWSSCIAKRHGLLAPIVGLARADRHGLHTSPLVVLQRRAPISRSARGRIALGRRFEMRCLSSLDARQPVLGSQDVTDELSLCKQDTGSQLRNCLELGLIEVATTACW